MQRRGSGATLASRGPRGRRGPGPAAPHAPTRQPCRATPLGVVVLGQQGLRGPFLLPPPFLPLPEPACISRRRRRPAHPQIRRFVVRIVWEIDPCILEKVLPLFNLSFRT
jgi:hypothetical protein